MNETVGFYWVQLIPFLTFAAEILKVPSVLTFSSTIMVFVTVLTKVG